MIPEQTYTYTNGDTIERIEPLISSREIQARIAELGAQITRDYAGKDLVVIAVLKGAFPFFADLVRHIDLPRLSCDFLGVSSYGSRTATSGVVRLTSDISKPVQDRHVLFIEDIIDTGLTMDYLYQNMKTRRPLSVECCALLHKPAGKRVDVPMKYVGFTIENHFVVGYGLDFDERYRQLPFVGIMHFDKVEDGAA